MVTGVRNTQSTVSVRPVRPAAIEAGPINVPPLVKRTPAIAAAGQGVQPVAGAARMLPLAAGTGVWAARWCVGYLPASLDVVPPVVSPRYPPAGFRLCFT